MIVGRSLAQSLRLFIRAVLPPELRLQISRARRNLRQRKSGQLFGMVGHDAPRVSLPVQISTTQPIFETELSANKIENLKLAAARITGIPIMPGQILSFWHLLPRPTVENGFLEGRTLVAGELVGESGGGLCQLSGILYHLAILADLKVLERHAHSVDLYDKETRFAPIGTDATVVFGYKDLLIENSGKSPVSFEFSICETSISAHLCSDQAIEEQRLETEILQAQTGKYVKIQKRDMAGNVKTVSEDFYANR